jgi:hypothetical protein
MKLARNVRREKALVNGERYLPGRTASSANADSASDYIHRNGRGKPKS